MSFSTITDSLRKIENLQKTAEKIGILQRQEQQTNSPHNPKSEQEQEFIGKPFWRWDITSKEHRQLAIETKGKCCFNHFIGLPYRNGQHSPIFPWQKTIYDTYQTHKYNWVLKATGLGLTEFTLRYILWKCTNSDDWSGSWVAIITGPRIDLARESIARMKDMISGKYPIHNATAEDFLINRVRVHAFPSNHLEAFRGIPSVKFIFLDEADFFQKAEQHDVRDTSERYIAKSDPQILMVSTPNRPGGLMERIQNETDSIYHKLFLPYTIGVGTMFTQEQIRENMKSPSFNREYNLLYLGEIGNVFHINDIEHATKVLGMEYIPNDEKVNTDPMIPRSMGVDPGFGSSMFGIVITQWIDGYIQVIYANEIERGSISECLDAVLNLTQKHRVMKLYVDSSAAGFIQDLKKAYGENRNYAQIIKENPGIIDTWIRNADPKVTPIPFGGRNREGVRYHESMLRNVETILQKKLIRIHPSFDKLNIALRTATSKDDKYNLDKEKTSHDDLLDALQLSLLAYYLKP